jgi:hypothetical protein
MLEIRMTETFRGLNDFLVRAWNSFRASCFGFRALTAYLFYLFFGGEMRPIAEPHFLQ